MTSWCRSCDREFSAPQHRAQHWRDSPHHHYCHVCKKHFGNENRLEQHALAVHPHSFCVTCGLIFQDEDGLHDHRWRSEEHPHYCGECRLDFSSANAHRQHMMSSAHQERDHHCGLGVCPESFISQAAVVLHWEAGACVSGIDFVDVYNKVVFDDDQPFTCSCEQRPEGTPVRKCDVEGWNDGHRLRCTDCPFTFQTPHLAMQHFNSTHIGKAFICPNQDCVPVAKFTSLSGTLQHIASDACGGANSEWIRSRVTKTMKSIRKCYNVV